MDLNLFLKVLWRYRVVVLPGVIATALLAFLAVAKVDTNGGLHVTYRHSQKYVSYSTLFVTKPGFPWGRLSPAADQQARFTSLAIIYSNLVTSDSVSRLIQPSGPIDGTIEAAPVLLPSSGEALPLIRIAAITDSSASSIALARRASSALRTWLRGQQTVSSTPVAQRVVVEEIGRADKATVFAKRSKTLAIVVFLTGLMAAIASAFVLENLRLNRSDVTGTEGLEPTSQPA